MPDASHHNGLNLGCNANCHCINPSLTWHGRPTCCCAGCRPDLHWVEEVVVPGQEGFVGF